MKLSRIRARRIADEPGLESLPLSLITSCSISSTIIVDSALGECLFKYLHRKWCYTLEIEFKDI
jgi:hypothetical protein